MKSTNINTRKAGMLRLMIASVLALFMVAQLPAQSSICPGDSVYITLTGYSGTLQWEYSTDGSSWSPMVGATSATMGDLPTAERWYRCEVLEGTCDPVYSDTSHVLISDLTADAGPDQLYCTSGSAVTLGGSPAATGGTAPYTYSWTPVTDLSSAVVANPTASPTVNTCYILTVTDSNGCTDSDTVCVTTTSGGASGSQTFAFTGALQTWTVPSCVDTVQIECWGAQGNGGAGGNGGYVRGKLAVNPGDVYNIYVGGQNGYNGGGNGYAAVARNGGGATDVRFGGTALANRIIVAGGGGGGGPTDVGTRAGGTGGGGTAGANYVGGGGGEGYGGAGGAGGATGGTGNTSCHSGGAGGGGFTSGGSPSCNTCYTGTCGSAGTLGQGGNSDTWETGICYSTYGGTNGGGGGYYGGGGSSVGNCGGGGGGGGSSWSGTLASPSFSGGVRSGNGQVVLTW